MAVRRASPWVQGISGACPRHPEEVGLQGVSKVPQAVFKSAPEGVLLRVPGCQGVSQAYLGVARVFPVRRRVPRGSPR
eukprot:11221940-Lingulodinium_polyedra.AAC.1